MSDLTEFSLLSQELQDLIWSFTFWPRAITFRIAQLRGAVPSQALDRPRNAIEHPPYFAQAPLKRRYGLGPSTSKPLQHSPSAKLLAPLHSPKATKLGRSLDLMGHREVLSGNLQHILFLSTSATGLTSTFSSITSAAKKLMKYEIWRSLSISGLTALRQSRE